MSKYLTLAIILTSLCLTVHGQDTNTPYKALKMATSTNAELLQLSGPRNDYREGELGVIREGAYADMIIVDGNPLEDLDLVADPDNNFVLIMKDGKAYKNTLR